MGHDGNDNEIEWNWMKLCESLTWCQTTLRMISRSLRRVTEMTIVTISELRLNEIVWSYDTLWKSDMMSDNFELSPLVRSGTVGHSHECSNPVWCFMTMITLKVCESPTWCQTTLNFLSRLEISWNRRASQSRRRPKSFGPKTQLDSNKSQRNWFNPQRQERKTETLDRNSRSGKQFCFRCITFTMTSFKLRSNYIELKEYIPCSILLFIKI